MEKEIPVIQERLKLRYYTMAKYDELLKKSISPNLMHAERKVLFTQNQRIWIGIFNKK